MRRRDVLSLFGGAAVSWPLKARAQQQAMPVIGFLNSASLEPNRNLVEAFVQSLSHSGYVEGKNLANSVASVFQQHAGALLVSGDAFLLNQADQIAKLGMRYVLPTCFAFREAAAAGGLMMYGADRNDTWRQVGNYVGRILKGEKPGELPVQQPTKFDFVINMQTAKALGLEVPVSLQLLADEVIE
jgi:ABC-type uncharacterized transport system substrate-binding protein